MGQARVMPHIAGVETAASLAQRQQHARSTRWSAVPLADQLSSLLPERGLVRGHQYQITGDASLSLMYALAARATDTGSWLAMVNMPRAGMTAAREHGIAMHRVLNVSTPANASSAVWSAVVGALVDGVDLVAVSQVRCSPHDARRLAARVRASGAVLLMVGPHGACVPDGRFSVSTTRWNFDAHLRSREARIIYVGRRSPTPRHCDVLLPGSSGRIESVS